MPRTANQSDALLADLQKRLANLVETARKEGRESALSDVRSLVGGGAPRGRPRKATADVSAKAAKPTRRKSSKPRKNPWAKYSAAEKLARINKMRKGRGLPPKKSL